MSNIEESYIDTIIGHLVNSGTEYLLLHLVQCWHACAVNEENQDIPMILYYSHMMYKYYSHLGFFPIKHNEEGKDVHNEIFNNIPHFIKNRLHVDFLQYCFVMYKNKVIIRKREVIPTIPNSVIHVYFCQKFIRN